MPSLGDLVVNLTANTRQFTASIGRAETRISRFARNAVRSLTSLRSLIAGAAVTSIGGAMVKLAADSETLTVQMEVLTGSLKAAKRVMADVSQFAASTPFQKLEIAEAARSLLAFGSSAENVVGELRMLGDISAATGTPLGDLSQIFGKARVQGRLFAEDINQLTGRGIPVIGAIAAQFGVAESEVKKLVEAGKVGFPELLAALQSMTTDGGKFVGMMQKMSTTTAGTFSTMKDNFAELAVELGTELLPAINSVIEGLTKLAKMGKSNGGGPQGWIELMNIAALKAQQRFLKLKADIDDFLDTTDWASNLRRTKGQTNDVQRQIYKDAVDRATQQQIWEVMGLNPNMGKALPGAGEIIPDPQGPQMPKRMQEILAGSQDVLAEYLTQTALPMMLRGSGAGNKTRGNMIDMFAIAAQGRSLLPGFTGWDMPPGPGLPGLSGLAGVGLGFGMMAQSAALGAQTSPLQFAGAAEKGSSSAFDTILAAMRGNTKSAEAQGIDKLNMTVKKEVGEPLKKLADADSGFIVVEDLNA